MFETVNEMAVLTVSLLALALGSIWYSPFLFGSVWQRVAGLSESDLTYTKSEFIRLLSGVLLANIVVFGVIAHVLARVPRTVLSLWEVGGGLMVFVCAVLMSMVMWEKRSFLYACIHSGYAVVVIGIGVAVIHFWPW